MKKSLSLILCMAIVFSAANVFAVTEKHKVKSNGVSGFSAGEIYIVPSEKTDTSLPVQSMIPCITQFARHIVTVKNIRSEDVYFPDILEQIDIISVAPRE